MTKTFSRARAAKAALLKLVVEQHEVPEEQFVIETGPVGDKFSAKITFNVDQPYPLLADLTDAGWYFTVPESTPVEVKLGVPAILELNPGPADVDYPAPAPTEETELVSESPTMTLDEMTETAIAEAAAAAGPAPVVKQTGYIKGVSAFKGATKKVWDIAESMPGAARKDVIAACQAAGIAFGTARTQYQAWFKAKKA